MLLISFEIVSVNLFQFVALHMVFINFFIQIDQEITALVTDQQKMDAERGHVKSQIEQIKQDIASATKQKMSIFKALEKKVYASTLPFTSFEASVWAM